MHLEKEVLFSQEQNFKTGQVVSIGLWTNHYAGGDHPQASQLRIRIAKRPEQVGDGDLATRGSKINHLDAKQLDGSAEGRKVRGWLGHKWNILSLIG